MKLKITGNGMTSRNDLMQFVTDAAANPKTAATVSAATSGIGFSTYLGYFEKGVGLAASATGLLLAIMMVHKVILEKKKLKIEIEKLKAED